MRAKATAVGRFSPVRSVVVALFQRVEGLVGVVSTNPETYSASLANVVCFLLL